MKKVKKRSDKKSTRAARPPFLESNLTPDETLDIFADIIIERVKERLIEEEQLYKKRLKIDPNAKRFYETDAWKKRWQIDPVGNKKR